MKVSPWLFNMCLGSTFRNIYGSVLVLHVTCGLEWEIALTYISSFSRRSVASASPHACSRCHGGGCCGEGHCHGAPSGCQDYCSHRCHGDDCGCPCGDLHWLRCRWGLLVNPRISWWQSVCVICEELYLWIASEPPQAGDLSALCESPSQSCRGCAAGDWREPWSSLSGRDWGRRVSGSSLHLAFWSNLTRGKTDSPISFTAVALLLIWPELICCCTHVNLYALKPYGTRNKHAYIHSRCKNILYFEKMSNVWLDSGIHT